VLVAALALTFVGAARAALPCPDSAALPCPYDSLQVIGGSGTVDALHGTDGVAIGPDQSVYATDAFDAGGELGRVVEFDSSGAYVGQLVPPSTYDSYGYAPYQVTVTADGDVFALDTDGVNVWEFAPGGAFVGVWKLGAGGQPVGTDRGSAIAAAPDDTLWVAYASHRIEHLDESGHVLSTFTPSVTGGVPGVDPIAVAPDGSLFIAAGAGVLHLSPTGQVLATISMPANALATDSSGNVYSTFGQTVYRASADGTGATSVTAAPAAAAGTQLAGIAVSARGVLVADGGHLDLLAADGSSLAAIGQRDPASLTGPLAAWGTPDGGVTVADTTDHRVVHFTAAGAFTGRADDGTYSYPAAGVLDPVDGSSLVIDDGSSTVKRFSPSGALIAQWPLPDGSESFGVRAIAAAPDGTVYVTDTSNPTGAATIAAYTGSGALIGRISDPHLYRPQAITVTPTGDILAADYDGVDVLAANGSYVGSIPQLGCAAVQSLTVDPAGRIFALDNYGIGVLAPDGSWLADFGMPSSAEAISVDAHDMLSAAEPEYDLVARLQIDVGALHPIAFPAPLKVNGICLIPGTPELATRALHVRLRSARLPLRCAGGATAKCVGTATLQGSVRATGRRPGPAHKATIARVAFNLVGGHKVELTLKVSKTYIAQHRHRRAHVVLALAQAGRAARSVLVTLQIPAAAKR
jgi:hypothetical protein